ncbi:MAG: hypothetical protein WC542_08610, partial [Paludibacter sp.]
MLALLVPVAGICQSNSTFIDDIYYKPSDAKLEQTARVNKKVPNKKNGAKEIIYIERQSPDANQVGDTATVLAQANDSTENYNDSTVYNQDKGYYLNGFNGNESDLEYAERIRRFHNPKYTIFIGDPRFNDIYFLNSSDWNVYIDSTSTYAYVTPTWTNPYWWDYNNRPYSYGGWGYSPYSYYNSWDPWGFNNFYGPYGMYGGMYGYGGM